MAGALQIQHLGEEHRPGRLTRVGLIILEPEGVVATLVAGLRQQTAVAQLLEEEAALPTRLYCKTHMESQHYVRPCTLRLGSRHCHTFLALLRGGNEHRLHLRGRGTLFLISRVPQVSGIMQAGQPV